MKITIDFLQNHGFRKSLTKWATKNGLIGLEGSEFVQKLLDSERYDDAWWALFILLDRTQLSQYLTFASNLLLPIFKSWYPNDDNPIRAIEASKRYLKGSSGKEFDYKSFSSACSAASAANTVYFLGDEDDCDAVYKCTRKKALEYGLSLLSQKDTFVTQ